jgi:hypothetical protein
MPFSSTEPHIYATSTPPRQGTSTKKKDGLRPRASEGSATSGRSRFREPGRRGASLAEQQRLEVSLPLGVEASEGEFQAILRNERFPKKDQPHLSGEPVLLPGVAASTGSHHVLPRMFATPGLGDHVIDVLRRVPAVLTGPTVSGEHRPASQGGPSSIRDADEVAEPNHRRRGDLQVLGPEEDPIRRDDVGLLLEYEDDCPSRRYDGEGLLRRVENEGSAHDWNPRRV